jgi:hypothetical protein
MKLCEFVVVDDISFVKAMMFWMLLFLALVFLLLISYISIFVVISVVIERVS